MGFQTSALLLLLACGTPKAKPALPAGGDPGRGKVAIEKYGCNACHDIPGISGPKGMVGPPLEHIARRAFIAGNVPNNPDTLSKWLQNPPAFDPKTSMPDIGVTPQDSRDITAYLETLK